MSTNDTVFVLASKKIPLTKSGQIKAFSQKLKKVCLDLAKMIVRDAEGATKFVEIKVTGAKSVQEAKRAGLSIANSSLFKSAIYGANANRGRIIAALGQAGIKLDEAKYNISMSDLKKKDIKIKVDLKHGKASQTIYTSDLTPEYIKINADYS
jgi:glutamate N-acetyltransferase/amino-acid N-acetyltransferase